MIITNKDIITQMAKNTINYDYNSQDWYGGNTSTIQNKAGGLSLAEYANTATLEEAAGLFNLLPYEIALAVLIASGMVCRIQDSCGYGWMADWSETAATNPVFGQIVRYGLGIISYCEETELATIRELVAQC